MVRSKLLVTRSL